MALDTREEIFNILIIVILIKKHFCKNIFITKQTYLTYGCIFPLYSTHFMDFSLGQNVTRTGKSTDDLDESELKAMGYTNMTTMIEQRDDLSNLDQENLRKMALQTSKNVSFHRHTIVQ